MEQHSLEFPISFREFQSHLTFPSEIPDLSVEWFAFREMQQFQIFWKLSPEISVPFVAVSKFSKFLVE